jgi:oligoribonuclease NrnB/cAMP/cGMP phosphodiesterase (DHH superfamily)
MIIQEYFENLYSSKLENQEEIEKFLDTLNPSKLNQEDINIWNRSITSNKIERVIKNLPAKKSPGPNEFTAEFTRPLKKNSHQKYTTAPQIIP